MCAYVHLVSRHGGSRRICIYIHAYIHAYMHAYTHAHCRGMEGADAYMRGGRGGRGDVNCYIRGDVNQQIRKQREWLQLDDKTMASLQMEEEGGGAKT